MVRSEGLLTVKTALCNELVISVPGNKYMLKVIIRNTRKECEIYSNLTRHRNNVNHVILVSSFLTLNIFLLGSYC